MVMSRAFDGLAPGNLPHGAPQTGRGIVDSTLWPTLQRVVRRRSAGRRVAGLLGGFAAVVLLAVAAVALDAAAGLPAWGLLAVDAVLLAALGGWAWRVLGPAGKEAGDVRVAAVALERRGLAGPSRLVNALQFAEGGEADAATNGSAALRGLAVREGEAAAEAIAPGALVDRAAVKRSAKRAAAAAGLLLVLAAWPGTWPVVGAVGPRLLSPLTGLPPYTPLRFEITHDPAEVPVGAAVTVTVQITGPNRALRAAEAADLVEVGAATAAAMVRESGPVFLDQAAAAEEGPRRFTARLARLDTPRSFYVRTEGGRSRTFTLTPDPAPRFAALHATLTPPDYARRDATTRRLAVPGVPGLTDDAGFNEIEVLRGTAVTLTARSNVPLAGAGLTGPQAEHPGEPVAGDPRTVAASFVPRASGTYRLTLEGLDGHASPDAAEVAVTLRDDAPPRVDITQPQPVAFAVEGYPVPVAVRASDDVGVASVVLRASVNDSAGETVVLHDGEAQRPARLDTGVDLDPAAMGAVVGDVVRYFAVARDARPAALGGPPGDVGQSAESAVHTIQIISAAQWEDMLRTQVGIDQLAAEAEALREELDALAEARAAAAEAMEALQEQLEADAPLTPGQQDALADLDRQLEAFAERSAALAEALRQRAEQDPLYEFEEPYQQRLAELAEQLEREAARAEAAREAAAALGQDGESKEASGTPSQPGVAPPPGLLPGLPGITPVQLEEFREQTQEFAEAGAPFDAASQEAYELMAEDLIRLELADELVFHGERVRAVIVEQRQLQQKLAAMQHLSPLTLGPADRQQLAAYGVREAELRDELEDAALMLRETAELAGPLLPRMSGGAVALCDALDALHVDEDLTAASVAAGAGLAATAHASASVAADKLESLLSEPGAAMAGLASDELDGCFGLSKAGLQSAMQQMAAARRAAGALGMGRSGSGGSGFSAGGGRSSMSMIGPGAAGRGLAGGGSGPDSPWRGPGRGGAAGMGDAAGDLGPAERIDPGRSGGVLDAVGVGPGVPARFRETAAAYFRRLAEDAVRGE
ncbi:MAG: hypothetical protein AAF710_10550 [Planctomycetota bacterium]